MARGMLTRLVFCVVIFSQSPLMYSAGGSPISPLQVVAKFIKEQNKSRSADDVNPVMESVGLALLFPGNVLRSALTSGSTSQPYQLNTTAVWEEGYELATKKMGWWKGIKVQEVLLAGSWCCIAGSLVSMLSGRMHFLALLGVGLLGYVMIANGLRPTLQYGLCIAMVLNGLAQRPLPPSLYAAATAAPGTAEAVPADASAPAGAEATESRKTK